MTWGACPNADCAGELVPDRCGAAVWPRRLVLLGAPHERARLHERASGKDKAGEDLRCSVCGEAFTEVLRQGRRR